MHARHASRLATGDEVKIKSTGEIKKVSHVVQVGKPNKYGYHVVVVTEQGNEYRNSEIS